MINIKNLIEHFTESGEKIAYKIVMEFRNYDPYLDNESYEVSLFMGKNLQYVLENSFHRLILTSDEVDRDIFICKSWLENRYNKKELMGICDINISKYNKILSTFCKYAYYIAAVKFFYDSDSLLCYNLSNKTISYLKQKDILSSNELASEIDNVKLSDKVLDEILSDNDLCKIVKVKRDKHLKYDDLDQNKIESAALRIINRNNGKQCFLCDLSKKDLAILDFIKYNTSYVFENTFYRLKKYYNDSKLMNKAISICKDWIYGEYDNKKLANIHRISYINYNKIIDRIAYIAYMIAFSKQTYNSDSLLCYNISNENIKNLIYSNILSVKQIADLIKDDINELGIFSNSIINDILSDNKLCEDIKKEKEICKNA